jgi:hypothetical protein
VDEHEVARQREVGAGPDGDAVHRRDRWLVELPQLPDERLHADAQRLRGGAAREALATGLRDRRRRQVHARAERVAGTGDQQGADVGVGATGAHRVDDLVAHLDREGVLGFRPIEGDAADVVGAGLDSDHGAVSSRSS